MKPLDSTRLQQALSLAEAAIGITEPNPRVGCVIGAETGDVWGQGATQQAGGPHAEVMALRDAAAAGRSVRGATAWVTLEPCAHHGRTPPCCDALIAAGLARVVVAIQDPFPQVAGAGIARMRAAGVQVDLAEGPLAAAALELNIGFFSRVLRQRPWVRVKVAASVDGRTALDNGQSQWITGPAARADGHAWRKRASAILTGTGTVLADNPRLDVRLVPSTWQPLRVVLDSRLRTPADARLFQPPGAALIVTAASPEQAVQSPLGQGVVELIHLPDTSGYRVDLHRTLAELARRGVNEAHVEAGPVLNGALLRAGLVDEWLVYLAPKMLGSARGMVAFPPISGLDQAAEWQFLPCTMVGPDLRLRLRAPSAPWLAGFSGLSENLPSA
jgi:diaminohydroxyphosphoribosylaminopyrimidine deaminase / 5-amino-6-(5-phosphoribosylamino)uracil reductase